MSKANISCKIVFMTGKTENGYCVYSTDIKPIDLSEDIYYIPSVDIFVDKISYNIFKHSNNKAFIAVDTGKQKQGKKIHALTVFKKDTYTKYRKDTLTNTDIDVKYETPKYLGRGTYGTVRHLPTEDIVVKSSNKGEQYNLPEDMIKEIAIYNIFNKMSCLPSMFGFILEPKVEIQLEKGVKTLHDALNDEILDYNQKRLIMFKLVKCMRAIASQGIINGDLKPANIILTDNSNVQIIDWGGSFIDTSYEQRKPKQLLSTITHRAPEVFLSESKDKEYIHLSNKADIFALGMLFIDIFSNGYGNDSDSDKTWVYGMLRILLNVSKEEIQKLGGPMKALEYFVKDKNEKIQNQIKEALKGNLFESSINKEPMPEELRDLISKMIVFNPDIRIGYDEVVVHPYFQNIHRESIPKPPVFINNMEVIPNLETVWKHKDVNYRMRKILFSWLKDVSEKTRVSYDSLFLSIQLLDLLFLRKHKYLSKKLLQGYGVMCLLISSMLYEDIPETVQNMGYLCDGAYKKDELFYIQKQIVLELEGNLIIPSLYTYLNHYNKNINIDELVEKYNSKDVYSIPFYKLV
jgi:serine/threonine protein kinase